MAYKVFTNGSVLNASEINDNLMNQSVMVFSNSTARAAALTAPVEGMLTWLQDTNRYEYRNGSGAWVGLGSGILQVLSTTKFDTFTVSSTTFTDITGFAVSVTPSATSSKIFISIDGYFGSNPDTTSMRVRLMRDATVICIGDAAGSRTRATGGTVPRFAQFPTPMSLSFLDSPSTTSAVTYKLQLSGHDTNPVYLNRSHTEPDTQASQRTASTITIMEVSG